MTIQSLATSALRPTQIAVGWRLMKWKVKDLRKLDRKPQELVDFILENPIRVVLGPGGKAYVIDHHHLALALAREKFRTAPVVVESDLSGLAATDFWSEMQVRRWVHLFDGWGRARTVADLPAALDGLEDDPYRSLAGFVRYHGGFRKTAEPYMEFQWADYFRPQVKRSLVEGEFDRALKKALTLAHLPAARNLPGYIAMPDATSAVATGMLSE